jgi:ABC-type glycerol-3-phosphate transport system substrate-binding protein
MEWLKAGKFVPLDDLYASLNVNKADVNQGGLFWCSYSEKTYCVGSYTSAVVLFYNRAMFDAAKLPYPSATEPMTVDEYAALAAKLTQKGSKPEDTVYGGDAPAPYWWSDYRTTFSEDGTSMDGIFNSESNIHLYDVLAHMIINGDAPSASGLTAMNTSAQEMMVQGKMAMVITDSQLNTIACETNHILYGTAPVPVAKKGDKPWVFAGTDMEGIPVASKNIEAAKTFLAFYLVEGNKLRLEIGDLSYNMKLANDLNWAGTGDIVGRQSELKTISLARFAFIVPGFWDVTAPVDGAYQDIIEGKSDARTALDGIMPQMKDTLATAWETWNTIK